ncbi:MAG: hypothetical protein MI976_30035 [Pseudomonadales bacterium]|nr:hypothetical protein [Pseudomonadales bacterium]
MNIHLRLGLLVVFSVFLSACFTGNSKDNLREPPAPEGISLELQVNLANGSTTADVAAAIYKDAVRQPLVGGDFFIAETRNAEDYVVLKSLQNLSGDYHGELSVSDNNDVVSVSTEYDPEVAREDRWYPVDELLVDPGPNEELIGFGNSFGFPEIVEASLGQSVYSSRAEPILLSWNPGSGDQMRAVSLVTCYGADGESYSYPRVTVLGVDDDGEANNDGDDSLLVSHVIPNETIANAIISFYEEVATIIALSILETYTFGLIDAKNIPLNSFVLTSCDVDLTLFREVEIESSLDGGHEIASTSDTVSFTFQP